MADEINNVWSWEQNKAFEIALATYLDDGNVNRWERIAAQVPGKSVKDVSQHFQLLKQDIIRIDCGRVPIPNYAVKDDQVIEDCTHSQIVTEKERRKVTPWSGDEHRSFLRGLAICGKSDWKRISREFVKTRTLQQVASHAQKYYIRQNTEPKDKKRSSIHDINTLDHLYGQRPITGEDNQLENVYPEYQREILYAGNEMESAYSEDEMRYAYAPIAVDNVFYLGNQTNDAKNQNPMENVHYLENQANNTKNDHPKDHKHR